MSQFLVCYSLSSLILLLLHASRKLRHATLTSVFNQMLMLLHLDVWAEQSSEARDSTHIGPGDHDVRPPESNAAEEKCVRFMCPSLKYAFVHICCQRSHTDYRQNHIILHICVEVHVFPACVCVCVRVRGGFSTWQ